MRKNDDGAELAEAGNDTGCSTSLPASDRDWLIEQPEFEDGDYPTERTLELIEKWPFMLANRGLDFVAAAWHWPDFGVSHELRSAEAEVVHAEPEDRFLRLATGGWSGNESIITAMRQNPTFLCRWCLSANGGLHIIRYWPDGPSPLAEDQAATEVSSSTAASPAQKTSSHSDDPDLPAGS